MHGGRNVKTVRYLLSGMNERESRKVMEKEKETLIELDSYRVRIIEYLILGGVSYLFGHEAS